MKKGLLPKVLCVLFTVVYIVLGNTSASAQCNNADFESGNFTGWTGTWGRDVTCNGGTLLGVCLGTTLNQPYQNNGLNQGPNNSAMSADYSHTIMTTGYDPVVGGTTLPVVFAGSSSLRLGNSTTDNGAETISYSFLVNNSNSNFTYHYAVVINDGGHDPVQQPTFQIKMTDGSGNPISCAAYDVNATSAPSIGGFIDIGGSTMYKPWTSVFIPLNNYIGQTVNIEFLTMDCGSEGGSHFGYAYIDAECAPLEIISSSPTVCGGQNITLTAPSGAATYSWTGPGVVPPTGSQQVVTVNLPGHYTVNMTTLGNTPCTFSIDTIIPPSPSNPHANFSYTPACVGDQMTFTDLSIPNGQITNWAWDFNNDGNPDALTQNPTYTFNTAGTYSVRLGVLWAPCAADTTLDVVVSPAPNSLFTVTTPICTGQTSTITYTGTAPPNATYTWNFDGGTVVTGTGQGPYTVSWPTAGTKNITLDVAIGSCTSTQTTHSVVVNTGPTINLPPPPGVCSGTPATINVSGATSYSWSPATGLNTTIGPTVVASPATTTTYTITGTTGGCSTDATLTVTVAPYPTVTVSPTTATVCAGVPTTFTANGGTTYTWQPAAGLSATTGTSIDATPLTTTTYSVIGNTSGCADTATFTVTVNPAPTLVLSQDEIICEGQTATLTAGGATSYVWTPATGLSTTTGPTVDATPASSTTYTVTGTSAGCSSSGDITVSVLSYPSISISPAVATICDGDVQTFTASGGSNYTWSPATGLSSTINATVDANPSATTTYMVVSSNLGCNDTAQVVLTVNPIPVVGVSPDVTICSGASTTLIGSGAGSYVWSPATGLNGTTGGSVVATPVSTTSYTVTGTSAGCSAAAIVNVTVNQTPVVTVDPSTIAFCEGLSADLTASGAATYVWSPALGLSAITGNTVTATPAANTTYTVVGTTNNCTGTATAVVTVNPNPVVDFNADTAGCEVFCTDFTNLTSISSGTFVSNWDFGDGNTSQQVSPSNCYNQAGTYTVELTAVSDQQCVVKQTLTDYITVYPLPSANFSVQPPSASILFPNFDFTDASSGAAEWYWDFGDGQVLGPSIASTSHLYENVEPGTYTATLIVNTTYGCSDTSENEVLITPQISLWVPNTITANNNKLNDVFYAKGEGIVDFEMMIFDRWGEYIFRSQDMEIGWDATYETYPVQPDVYLYLIRYTDLNGDSGEKRGHVTVLR